MGFDGKEVILVQLNCGPQKSIFYVVDLKAQKIVSIPFATLYNEAGQRSIVRLGSVIYNVGGESNTEFFRFEDEDEDDKHHIHLSVSCLELSEGHLLSVLNQGDDNALHAEGWKGAACLQFTRKFVSSAVLWGNIYVLGGLAPPNCIGEVFMPEYGHWKPLPPPPQHVHVERFCVSSPVIPDEPNGRLLVHFPSARALYAYHPATQHWHCIDHNFYHWGHAIALVDGVIYCHVQNKTTQNCIVAYDLLTKSWLEVVYSSHFPSLVCVSPFVDMLHLGNNVLCLANSYPLIKEDDPQSPRKALTNFQFVKFRVYRTSPKEVHVTPIAIKCFLFENYWSAQRFIAL